MKSVKRKRTAAKTNPADLEVQTSVPVEESTVVAAVATSAVEPAVVDSPVAGEPSAEARAEPQADAQPDPHPDVMAAEPEPTADDAPSACESQPEVQAEAIAITAATAPDEPVNTATESTEPAADAAPVITLASNCTVKDAVALKDSLCAIVDSEAAITLDVSSVERIDTATIQVLCAFVRQRVAAARSVVWMGVPEAVQEAARLLGVQALLKLPAENAGGAA